MAATHDDRFRFTHSRLLPGVTALRAVMRDFSYERHAHEEVALGVTLAGRQDFFCKGSYFRSRPGKVLLFNPDDAHDGSPGGRSTLEYAMLYIRADQLTPLMAPGPSGCTGFPRIPGTLLDDPVLRRHILSLSRLVFADHGSRMEQELHLYEIAARLSRLSAGSRPGPAPQAKDALTTVRDFIHEHIHDDLSIDTLRAVANISKYHFIRMFRARFGITPHRYVLSCRINRARAALERGCAPTDTAQMFGFSDVSHLNRRFKRSYGLTPKQYQLQFCAGIPAC